MFGRRALPGTLLTSALLVACGGRVGISSDQPDSTPVSTGGHSSAPDISDGVPGPARPGGSGSGSTVAGSPPIAGGPDSGGGGACPLPWWGSSLEGVKGVRSCVAPSSPAILMYSDNQFLPCMQLTGPVAEMPSGETLRCAYHMDESACGNPYQGDFWVELPLFGDGSKQVSIPDGPVSFAGCEAPEGPKLAFKSDASRADNVVGLWLGCTPPQGGLSGNAMAFFPDGTWQALQTDDEGRLRPAAGCFSSGLWGFSPELDQLLLYMGNETFHASLGFIGGTPRKLVLASSEPWVFVAAE